MQAREAILRATLQDDTQRGLASVKQNVAQLGKVVADAEKSANRRQDSLVKNSSVSLAREAQGILRSVNPLAAATSRYNQQLAKLRSAQREGAIGAREFAQGVAGLNERLRQAEQRAAGAGRRSLDLGRAFRQAAGAAAAIGGGVSVGLITNDAVRTIADYEARINAVRAVTSATAAETEKLSATARKLGAETAFNASEAASAMEALGQAGFSTNEILASVPGTLALAASGSVELGRAAEISANVLRGFNLQAAESGRVSDVLALASVRTNATVNSLGEALKFAAPTATAFGISVEETVASVGKLADAGLSGGIGGRGFQAVSTALVKERDKVEALIGDFDLQAEGLTAVIKRIGQAGASQGQILDIFKAENFDAFNILKLAALDAATGTDTLTEALKNAEGEAQRLADVRFDGLKKAFDEAGGARDEFFLKIGEAGASDAIVGLANAARDAFNSQEAARFASSIGQGVAGAVSTLQKNWDLVVTATKLATVAAVTYTAVQWAGTARNIATIGAAWAGVTAATSAAGTALAFASVGGVAGIARGVASIAGNFVAVGAAAAAAAVAAAPLAVAVGAVVAAGAALVVFRKDIAEAVTGTRDVGVALEAAGRTISEAFAPLTDGIAGARKEIDRFLESTGKEFSERFKSLVPEGFGKKAAEDFKALGDASRKYFEDLIKDAKDAFPILEKLIATQAKLFELAKVANPIALAQRAGERLRGNAAQIELGRLEVEARNSDPRFSKDAQKSLIGLDTSKLNSEVQSLNAQLIAAGREAEVLAQLSKDTAVHAGAAADEAERLADAEGKAAEKAQELAAKIAQQGNALSAQIAQLKTLNDARAGGASESEIALIEKRQELIDRFPEFAKANRDLFDQEVERLAFEERRADLLKETQAAEKQRLEDVARAQEQVAQDLQRRSADLARGFADVFTDVWRSFRRDGLSAIDVIKDALRNAFDNFIGQTIEQAFRPLAEQIVSGRTPDLNQAGQIFSQAALDARAKGLDGPADPFGQSPGVSTAGITTRDLQFALNGQVDVLGNLAKSIKGGFDNFIAVGTNLGQSLGKLLGGGGSTLGALGGGAAGGFAGFQLGTGVADLFNGRQGETGSKVGGAVGGGIGFLAGGPIGAAIGSAAGSFIGDILGGLFGRKTGSATFNLATGAASDVKNSKKDSRNELRDTIGQAAVETVGAIAEILEASLDSALGLRINVGKKTATADLIDGQGRKIASTPIDRNDVDGAVKDALRLVIDRGFEGLDTTLGKVTKALASTSLPAATLVESLSTISEALRFGEEEPSVWAAAIKEVTKTFGEAIDAASGLASAVKDLADVQVEALQKIASNFDEDIERQLRTIRAPEEQQAIDLLEAQLKRLADAQTINQSLADATARAASAPAAPTGAGGFAGGIIGAGRGFGGVEDFYRGGAAFNFAGAAAANAAPAIETAAQATQSLENAANDNSEAQARLARVNELAQAEWEQFIEQAGSTPDALAAVAAALSSIGERAEELGLDLASLEDQLAEVRRGLASTFDQDVERQRLAIEAPGEARALELLDEQTKRLEAARAVSDGAADTQERLNRVIALNTAQWREFIEQASSTPEALADAANALDRFAEQLAAQGVDPSLLRQRVADARGQLAGNFNDDVAQRFLALANPTLAEFNSLLEEQRTRVETAQSLGANVSGAERLNALERRRFFEGLSDQQKTELGDFLGIIEDFSGRYAFVLSEFLGSTQAARESLEEVAAGYEESADAWKSVTENLRGTLDGIRSEFAPGNLSEQLAASQGRFDEALARSRDTSLSGEDRRAAAQSLGTLGQEVLRINRDLNGTTDAARPLFERITSTLEGVIAAGGAAETLDRQLAESSRAAAEALGNIERQLQQPDLSLPILEESRTALAAIEGVNQRQVELLDELIAVERARAAQQEFTIGALQNVAAPLLPSTGNPVADAEAARVIARAIEQGNANVVGAIATQSDVSEERLRALEAAFANQADELNSLKNMLRNFLENQAAQQAQAA